MWPDRRVLDLLRVDLPILQAPMAGANGAALAIAVAEAGGLGAIPCAMLTAAQIRDEVARFRGATARPLNLNFFCHVAPAADEERDARWRERLRAYQVELGIDGDAAPAAAGRAAFDEAACTLVEELRPEVVSFHFGLPAPALLARVRGAGASVLSSATTVAEARWLEARGCDAIIAQGVEAGGHRGWFLGVDDGRPLAARLATQVGTFALVPQVVDAVTVPVIAAGAIADGRGVAAALALGAAAVQIGTAYLHCPEATITPMHRRAIAAASDDGTALTNVYTGGPARGLVNRLLREVGPLSELAPPFPLAGVAVAPLRARAERAGSGDFSPQWAGQAAALGQAAPARALTDAIAADARMRLAALWGGAAD